MHKTQLKIIELSTKKDIEKMGPREIGRLIGVDHPQIVVYHMTQLRKRGLLRKNTREILDKLRKNTDRTYDLLIDIPILGAANCGIATLYAQEAFEGYLKISAKFLPNGERDGLFALRAEGDSMDKAHINGKNVEEGDYLLVDSNKTNPKNGDYILSIIDSCANIKKFNYDTDNERIVLYSESSKNYPPIYIHPSDDYLINGLVISVIKKMQEE
jgi:SOS-response transcriptional repressor LexA